MPPFQTQTEEMRKKICLQQVNVFPDFSPQKMVIEERPPRARRRKQVLLALALLLRVRKS